MFHELTAQIAGQSKSESLAAKAELENYLHEIVDAQHHENEAEVQLEHSKAKLEQAGGNTPDRLAAKKLIETAKSDVQSWSNKISAINKQIDDRKIATSKADHFNFELEAMANEIRELTTIVSEMDQSLTKMNIELDAPSAW